MAVPKTPSRQSYIGASLLIGCLQLPIVFFRDTCHGNTCRSICKTEECSNESDLSSICRVRRHGTVPGGFWRLMGLHAETTGYRLVYKGQFPIKSLGSPFVYLGGGIRKDDKAQSHQGSCMDSCHYGQVLVLCLVVGDEIDEFCCLKCCPGFSYVRLYLAS